MPEELRGISLDREGARQTVVGGNSVILLLDMILQGRLGSEKNSPVFACKAEAHEDPRAWGFTKSLPFDEYLHHCAGATCLLASARAEQT